MLLMRTGEQAWFMSPDRGNHEFARVSWLTPRGKDEPQYILKEGHAKLGGVGLLHAALDDAGALLTWDNGAKSWIPREWYQYTWS